MYLTRHKHSQLANQPGILVVQCHVFWSLLSVLVHSYSPNGEKTTSHKQPIELKCWQVISYFIREISCHPFVSTFGAVVVVWSSVSFAFAAQIFYWFSAVWMLLLLLPLFYVIIILLGKPVAMMLPLVCLLVGLFVSSHSCYLLSAFQFYFFHPFLSLCFVSLSRLARFSFLRLFIDSVVRDSQWHKRTK